jgi:hypothetical protein
MIFRRGKIDGRVLQRVIGIEKNFNVIEIGLIGLKLK